MKANFRLNWRTMWYCAVIFMMAFLVDGFVVLPWFYIVLPLVILLVTVYYLDAGGQPVENVFAVGLAAAIGWFFLIAMLSLVEIAGFYYFNFAFYFSDLRNWFLYPLVLLVPVVYSIILENGKLKKNKTKRSRKIAYGRANVKNVGFYGKL